MRERGFGPVQFIPGDNKGKWPACHSVYIKKAGILIDPASSRDRLKKLRDESGVNEIWLSHWHEDHIAHLDLFDDLPLRMSQLDAPQLADLGIFLKGYGFAEDEHGQFWRQMMVEQFHYRPRKPAEYLYGGQIIELEDLTVEVIHTPGHTPGHLAFYFKESAALFMGDYDLTKFGPWYGDREGSIQETISSVNRLRTIPAKVWLTSHEDGVFDSDVGDLWDRYLSVIDVRENKLLDFLQQPRTMSEIVDAWIVYRKPREPKAFFAFGEKAIMGKHLDRLIEKSIVAKDGEHFYLTVK
jgi:glyoxylase-like metal-dependent hydrolase (beta-lactamase superfamily II)